MSAALERLVWNRARNRCEYCSLDQKFHPQPFHIDHIRAKQHGGRGNAANLCLACAWCNAHKGPNLSSVDPETDVVALLFNPRLDRWREHFTWRGPLLVGGTASGRATVQLLAMNAPRMLQLRARLMAAGIWPYGRK